MAEKEKLLSKKINRKKENFGAVSILGRSSTIVHISVTVIFHSAAKSVRSVYVHVIFSYQAENGVYTTRMIQYRYIRLDGKRNKFVGSK